MREIAVAPRYQLFSAARKQKRRADTVRSITLGHVVDCQPDIVQAERDGKSGAPQ